MRDTSDEAIIRLAYERMDAVVKEWGPLLEGIQKRRPLVERVEAELKAALGELKLARLSSL